MKNLSVYDAGYRKERPCGVCGEMAKANRRNTTFCTQCHYTVTRIGSVERGPSHPLFEKLSFKIFIKQIPIQRFLKKMEGPLDQYRKAPYKRGRGKNGSWKSGAEK